MSLKHTIREAALQSSLYGLGTMAAKVVGFLMIPIYTRYLVPEQYGTIEVVVLTVDLLGTVLAMGVSGAILRFYYDGEGPRHVGQVVGSGLFVAAISSLLIATLGAVLAAPLARLLLTRPDDAPYFRIVFATMAAGNLVQCMLVLYRAEKRPIPFVWWSLAATVIGLSLNVYLVVFQLWGVLGVLYSGLWTQALVLGGLVLITFTRFKVRLNRSLTKSIFKFAYPFAFTGIGSFVLQYADRYLLRLLVGLSTVGIYSLAYKLALGLSAFITFPFMSYWGAKVLELHRENAYNQVEKMLTYYLAAWTAPAFALALFSRDIIRLMAAPMYHAAATMLPVLILGMFFFAVSSYLQRILIIERITGVLARGYIVAALINVAANLVLIPRYGGLGASAATAVGFGALAGIYFRDAQRARKLTYEWTRIAKLTGSAALLTGLGVYLLPAIGWDSIAVRLVLLATWIPILIGIRFFTRPEAAAIRQWAGALRARLLGSEAQ